MRAWHRVEWSRAEWILVDDVEVEVILALHQHTQMLLLRSTEGREKGEGDRGEHTVHTAAVACMRV